MVTGAIYYLQNGLGQLLRYGVQSLLVVLGVAIGTANIIVLVSITDLGRNQTMGIINDLGANVLVVIPYVNADQGAMSHMMSALTPVHLPTRVIEAVSEVPSVDAVAPVLSLPGTVTYGAEKEVTTVLGVNELFLELRGHRVERGRWLTAAEFAEGSNTVCLGLGIAGRLFGEEDPLGQVVEIRGREFTVAGVMEG